MFVAGSSPGGSRTFGFSYGTGWSSAFRLSDAQNKLTLELATASVVETESSGVRAAGREKQRKVIAALANCIELGYIPVETKRKNSAPQKK